MSSDTTGKHTQIPDLTLLAPQAAPFIYFDGTSAYGVAGGAIQVELAANMLCPTEEGIPIMKAVMTAHLRCSPTAAAILRDSLQGALDMIETAVSPAAKPKSELN